MNDEKFMKVAIVHYWLVGMRGGEKVLEMLCEMYPEATIYTNVYRPEKISKKIKSHTIITTFIDRLPLAKVHYQKYLPLMPLALESLDLTSYDLIISSESGPAKGIIPAPNAVHVCYCHSPMRYIWDKQNVYSRRLSWLGRIFMNYVAHKLRMWDVSTASRVDLFIANSSFVQKRIKKYYRRDSCVIHPPVADLKDKCVKRSLSDYYLYVGELIDYKGPSLAVSAFNVNGKKLKLVGAGADQNLLKKAAHCNIEFLGRVTDDELMRLYAGCKALIFPGEEDFGIIPLEAMQFGKPVIALKAGGALDTVIDGETGCFFEDATESSLNDALSRFEERVLATLDSKRIIEHSKSFSEARFKKEIAAAIDNFVHSG